MTAFKVGDTVRTDGGYTFEICHINAGYALNSRGNHYAFDDLTLVTQAPVVTHRFKVGDMVRFPKNPDAGVWKITHARFRSDFYDIELPGQPETRCFDQDMSACELAHKFKVGDVVLPLDGYMRGKVAKPAKVIEVRECDGYVRIDTGAQWFLNPDALKHAVVNPMEQLRAKPGMSGTDVDTVTPSIKTSRRVTPGKYGIVDVTDTGRVEIFSSVYTADELREAAHVLNQIAEVLDDE